MAEGGEERLSRQRNMQGLLNFCTEITVREDPTHNNPVQLSEERRKILEEVLNSWQGDVPKQMAECLKSLNNPAANDASSDITEQEQCLELLSEYVEDLNYAKDLEKLHGYPILVSTLKSPHPALQQGAARVIGDICQNNMEGQEKMLPLGVMEILLNILDTHPDSDCKASALYAISCLTRDFEPSEKHFMELSGFCFIMRAIQTKIAKLIIKSVFFLNYFTNKAEEYKESLLSRGFVEQLISLLLSEDASDTVRELCAQSLYHLCSDSERAKQDCFRTEFQLIIYLRERRAQINSKEEYEDECGHVTNLLNLLEPTDENEDLMIR